MAELQRVEIICGESGCDNTRLVHRASLKEVTRCKECQIEHKRAKARQRYRKRAGLPLDEKEYIKFKESTKKTPAKKFKASIEEIDETIPEDTRPEEERLAALLALTDDCPSVEPDDEDW